MQGYFYSWSRDDTFATVNHALVMASRDREASPSACCCSVSPAPESWIHRAYNLVQRNISPRGGHFPAMEDGDRLVADMRAFFRRYR